MNFYYLKNPEKIIIRCCLLCFSFEGWGLCFLKLELITFLKRATDWDSVIFLHGRRANNKIPFD